MTPERIKELKRKIILLPSEAELQGFMYSLNLQGELNGVTRHLIEVRRADLKKRKVVGHG